jgi:hypothetical protein
MKRKICENCKYWEQLEGDKDKMLDKGNCHRYPPVIPEIQHGCIDIGDWWFPCVFKDDWCGEFKEKE